VPASDVIGLGASVVVWAAGLYSSRRRYTVAIARLPDSWLSHPEIGPAYREARPWGRRELVEWIRRLPPYLAGDALFLSALVAVDVLFVLQLSACVAFAALNSFWILEADRRRLVEFMERYELSPLRPSRLLLAWYVASRFAASLGFVAFALFSVRIVFALA